jgi:hypothetical protein
VDLRICLLHQKKSSRPWDGIGEENENIKHVNATTIDEAVTPYSGRGSN